MLARNIGAQIKAAACQAASIVAAGAGDNTEVDGEWIDRQGYLSASLVILFDAVLADGEDISIGANLQDASDDQGTGAADYGAAIASAVRATGGVGGSTEIGVVKVDFDLSGADRYVRAQFTPDLSAANTDTAIVSAILVLGGADVIPAV